MVGPVCLWSPRLLPGVGACFNYVGTSERLSYMDHVRCMVQDHMQIEHGGHMACRSGFPLQVVHQFKMPPLLDMSNCLSCGCHQVVIYWINDDLIELF
jgi:hypothetical protein